MAAAYPTPPPYPKPLLPSNAGIALPISKTKKRRLSRAKARAARGRRGSARGV